MSKGLLVWINSLGFQLQTLNELPDVCYAVLHEIMPDACPAVSGSADAVTGMQEWISIVRQLDASSLHIDNKSLLDIDIAAMYAGTDEGLGVAMLARLLLAAAVKCSRKGHYIQGMMALPSSAKSELMQVIQQQINSSAPIRPHGAKRVASSSTPSPVPGVGAASSSSGSSDEVRVLRDRLAEVEALAHREEEQTNAWRTEAEQSKAAMETLKADVDHLNNDLTMAKQQTDVMQGELRQAYEAIRVLEEKQVSLEASSALMEKSRQEARRLRDELDVAHESMAKMQQQSSQAAAAVHDQGVAEALKRAQLALASVTARLEAEKAKSVAAKELREEVGRLRAQTKAQEEKSRALMEQNGWLKTQVKEETHKVADLQSQLAQQQTEMGRLAATTGAAAPQETPQTQSLLGEMQQLDDSGEAAALCQQLAARDAQLEALQAQKPLDEQQLQQTQQQLAELQEQLRERDARLLEISQTPTQPDRSGELDALQQQEALQGQLVEAQTQIHAAQQERDALREHLKKAKAVIERLRSQPPAQQAASGGVDAARLKVQYEQELKLMLSAMYQKGVEVVRLRHQLHQLQQSGGSAGDTRGAVGTHGLLHHLRHKIDPYNLMG